MARPRVGNQSGQMRTRLLPAIIVVAAALCAQSPATGPMQFTATTANVAAAPEPVRFEIIRWSSDAEREALLAAWQGRPAGGAGAEKGAAGRGVGEISGFLPCKSRLIPVLFRNEESRDRGSSTHWSDQ